MPGGQGARGLNRDLDDLPRAQRATLEPLPQGFAVNELRGNEIGLLVSPDFVYRQNVGVIESRGGKRLLLETEHPIAVQYVGCVQKLERDVPFQTCVAGQINFSHPALAEER